MKKIVVGISQGDVNGVSYELVLKVFEDTKMLDICTPVFYGSEEILSFYKKRLGINKFHYHVIPNCAGAKEQSFNLINCMDRGFNVSVGQPTKEAGQAAFDSLELATTDLRSGAIDVLVTCPINKNTIQSDTFHFHGHTEYFQAVGGSQDALMMMVSDRLRLALATNHVAIEKLSSVLTKELLELKLNLFIKSLQKDFSIRKPRIAVLGLNPHAGDGGLLGSEDEMLVKPVTDSFKENNHLVYGPFPADGFWSSEQYRKYDGVFALYHDQGLIPFKMLADGGVNFTAGLDFVRTSPAHGVAYDIAGLGEASPKSFRDAIYAAIDIVKSRILYQEIHANVLKINNRDRRGGGKERRAEVIE